MVLKLNLLITEKSTNANAKKFEKREIIDCLKDFQFKRNSKKYDISDSHAEFATNMKYMKAK